MSYLAYVIVVAIFETALVWNVRYLFSRHPLPTLAAVIIFILGLIPPIIKSHMSVQTSPIYTVILAFVFCVDLMFLLIMGIYYFFVRYYNRQENINQIDYIVILGSKFMSTRVPPIMMSRLDRAMKLYQSIKPHPQIIVSGGKSSVAKIKESTIMRDYLVENGIPDTDIIVEDKSENTAENLEYSSITIKRHWRENFFPKIAIVTSEFHIPRVRKYAQRIGLYANFVPATTMPIFKWPAMFREFTAIIWYYRYTIETIMLMIVVLLICTFVP